MGFDNRAADRESYAHAGLLRRKECLKQIGFDVIVESVPRIGHRDLNHVVGDPGIGRDKLPFRRLRHRFKRIAEQIDQYLLNLHPVHQNPIERRVQIEAKLDVLLTGARQTECARRRSDSTPSPGVL